MHHAHHCGDDAEGGQAVADAVQRMRRHLGLVAEGLDLVIHQGLDLEGVHIAVDHHAQVVRQELHHARVGKDARILAEHAAGRRVSDFLLEEQDAFAAGLGEQDIEQRHDFHVQRLAVLAAAKQCRQHAHGGLDRLAIIGADERADGRACNDDKLCRLIKRAHVATGHGVSAKHRRYHDNKANYN